LGGVVFRWQPEVIIQSVFADADAQRLVRTGIFQHSDWVELDRGSIPVGRAIKRAVARTGLPSNDIERLFHAVPRHLTPIDETLELIRDVKNANNKLYVLSNMHLASISYLEDRHRIFDLFDGRVVSCRVQKVKPELAIYEHLLNEYRLNAVETVFIDDMAENVDAAASLGIQTVRFVNASRCRRALEEMNCFDI
jgi:putative hydrolase of the HAD superfamily